MYSVLIFNNETMESFKLFKPLFTEAVKRGDIGLCPWNDSIGTGDSIETVLPKLYDLVGDKKEWRAVVVQSSLPATEGITAADSRNPFDYICYREKRRLEIERVRKERTGKATAKERRQVLDENYNMHEESPIPLIRMTQMLGGIPEPDIVVMPYDWQPQSVERAANDENGTTGEEHLWTVIDGDGQDIELVYYPENITLKERREKENNKWSSKIAHDATAEALYARLTEQYRLQANPPAEIIIVAVRPRLEESLGLVKESWKNYNELQSSEFWHYNHYPQCCRFLTYEIDQRGNIQKEGDLFRLWLCISLIATNPLDPSSFQAHRLYKMNIKLNRENLSDAFHNTSVKLLTAATYLKRSIEQDYQRKLNDKIDPPDYKVNITVELEDERLGDVKAETEKYGLAARDGMADCDIWRDDDETIDENLARLNRLTGRAVENSAERMRGNCTYCEDAVDSLSDFQAREFSDKLQDTYTEVLDNQLLLDFGRSLELKEDKEEKSKTVYNILKSRMTARRIIIGYVISEAAALVAVIPGIIHGFRIGQPIAKPLFISLFIAALAYFIAVVAVVCIQRKELNNRIDSYNVSLDRLRSQMENTGTAYSRFLSSVGSYMKGSSYLNILRRKMFKREDLTIQKRKHLRNINEFMLRLEEWGRSVYINCDYDSADQDEIEYDATNIPNFDSLYTLASGKNFKVPMNEGGHMMNSPFSFIDKLEVIREELYDDTIGSN